MKRAEILEAARHKAHRAVFTIKAGRYIKLIPDGGVCNLIDRKLEKPQPKIPLSFGFWGHGVCASWVAISPAQAA